MTQKIVDENLLSDLSKQFANALFKKHPQLKSKAQMEKIDEEEKYNLVVEIVSPTGDKFRNITLFMAPDPSIAFGSWHTHSDCLISDTTADPNLAIIDLLEAILADQFAIIQDIGGTYDGHTSAIDLRKQEMLVDELTSEYSPGHVRLLSFTGDKDKEIDLTDLKI